MNADTRKRLRLARIAVEIRANSLALAAGETVRTEGAKALCRSLAREQDELIAERAELRSLAPGESVEDRRRPRLFPLDD